MSTLAYTGSAAPPSPLPDANDLIQRMPESMLRLNPKYTQSLAVWLSCMSSRWYAESVQGDRGQDANQRKATAARRRYAKTCLSAVQQLIDRLSDRVKSVEFYAMMKAMTDTDLPDAPSVGEPIPLPVTNITPITG